VLPCHPSAIRWRFWAGLLADGHGIASAFNLLAIERSRRPSRYSAKIDAEQRLVTAAGIRDGTVVDRTVVDLALLEMAANGTALDGRSCRPRRANRHSHRHTRETHLVPPHGGLPDWATGVGPATLIIIDEAGMGFSYVKPRSLLRPVAVEGL
jgi:hypothetical protein